jgi:cell division transport system permease protein
MLIHFKRIIRSGWHSFRRGVFTSIASILIMTITLFVITSLIFVQAALNASLNDIKEKVDVTIYFIPGAEETSIKKVEESIVKLPEIKSVVYTSAEEALSIFRERHSNDYLTLQALDELSENPLGASLSIKANDPSQYESIAKYFENDDALSKGALTIIDKIDYNNIENKMVIERLTSIIKGASKLGFVVSFVLVIISIIITFNTIRLIIYMSREEISVMRLVGAGSRYVKGPFIVSGILVGICASFLTILIFIPISIWLGNHMTNFIGINLYQYYKSNFLQLFIIMLGSGVLLGSISSFFAINRYLRK